MPGREGDNICRFCGALICNGLFCRSCVSLRRAAITSLAAAAVAYHDPDVGPLVLRNGPHSYLIRQPTEGTWES